MPNMIVDNLLIDAQTIHYVSATSLKTANADFALQNAVQAAINTAALTGAFTATLSVAAYDNTLIQLLIERLINVGYVSAVLTSTTLVITWN